MSIRVILWDVDGTLLNFHEAEKYAIRKCFEQVGFPYCTDEMLHDYSGINVKYWKRLEKGEITRPQVLRGRFVEFFEKYGLDTGVVDKFNEYYQVNLGNTVCYYEGAYETVNKLKGYVRQYAVTNGSKVAQKGKLSKSGYDQLLDGVFISEDIGYEKPSVDYFRIVWEKACLYDVPRDEVLIVGDSLTSDMRGGINMGIKTCWFNPDNVCNESGNNPDYTVSSIPDVLDIVLGG